MQAIPKDEWIPRFARKLREMIPEATGDEAMSLALVEATFPKADDLTPKEAVEICLLEEPPGVFDDGQPSDGTAGSDNPS